MSLINTSAVVIHPEVIADTHTGVSPTSTSPMMIDAAGNKSSGLVQHEGLSLFLFQIKLLVWKRYRESTKTKSDLMKIFAPGVLFFALLLLLYNAFGFFSGGGLEPFFVPFAFWLFVQRIVVQIMFEKSSRVSEAMRMMGLKDSAYWISYFLADGVILGFVISFICAIMSTGGLFNGADFGTVLGFLFTFCLAAVSFGFFLTAFFDTPQSAGQATLAVLIGLFVIYVVMFPAGKATIPYKEAQIICCLVPPLALQIGSGAFLKSYDGISIEAITGILVADIFIYLLLAWYFSEIWPSSIGVRKPWYFPLQPSFWFPKTVAARAEARAELTNGSANGQQSAEEGDCLTGSAARKVIATDNGQQPKALEEGGKEANSIPIESVNQSLLGAPVVQVKNLCKTFGSTKVVNNLSFDMYENQIFALLGHNGAGKSTTISMLTGLIPPDYKDPSKSNAYIYGKSIIDDMASIRFSLGVCPQHDVLFENLTVREHIIFFSQLKGFTIEEADAEATELTKLFHLENRLDHLGNELSGGQRRKLSVAIAVCGGSKLVVLDEPTAGMDPLARRELWDLLSSLRQGRTMLLTTHYMDEADILGDRIGIMSLGQMQCMGTSHFLKTTYGAGYKLIFDTDKSFSAVNVNGVQPFTASTSKKNAKEVSNLTQLTEFVQSFVPTATLVTNIAGDIHDGSMPIEHLTYNLPFDAVHQFGKLFNALESPGTAQQLLISEYNLSITSLEDVFLKVGEDHSVTPQDQSNIVGIGKDRVYHTNFTSQVIGLMWRKLINASNDFTTLPLLALPVAAMVAAAALYQMNVISGSLIINDLAITGIYIGGYLGAAGFIAEFVVRERADKLRNVLTVMGCGFEAYWVGTFLADLLLMMIPCVIMWITWGASGMEHFYGRHAGLCFFISILFTVELICFAYFFSFIFTSPKSCISFMPMLILLLLVLPNVLILIAILIANAAGTSIGSTALAGALLWGMMILSPHGAFYCAMLNIINDFSIFIVGLPPIGVCIAFMLVESALFFGYAYYTDSLTVVPVGSSIDTSFDEKVLEGLDDDVQAERDRVLGAVATTESGEADIESKGVQLTSTSTSTDRVVSSDPLVVSRLRKVFPPKIAGRSSVTACEDVAFSVGRGEIFGLLGANGAGKTTALSMLTRLLVPTSGDATIMSHSILSNFTKAATHLGVVTQNNSLWDRLSVEDHLYLFARLRGVPEDLVQKIVDGTIDQLELTPHRKKLSMSLSGGMKRKLCVAIALIGDPEVVLLDEPSAGLDPVSRRNLWTVIMRTMSSRSVILTTHSMEEAEALCKRIGIMVRGQLRALGTKQRLKNKFGSGFELTMKLHVHDIDAQRQQLTTFVTSLFPSAFVLIENGGLFTYQIPKEEMSIGKVFTELEANKKALNIEDYSVAQPTLEQVFIRTVNKHTPDSATLVAEHVNAMPEKVVQDVNKCGCTDFTVKIMTVVAFAIFLLFLVIAIAVVGRSNNQLSSGLVVVGFVGLFVGIVGICLLCCACCRPPKGGDE